MKFTFSWLQKFLKTKKSLKDICEKLTLLGIEVSEIIDNQDVLKPFKIAQVVDVKDHPNADRLKLCKINDGNKTFNIVCGASNVKKNMKAILAPVGTRMPTGDFTIQKTHHFRKRRVGTTLHNNSGRKTLYFKAKIDISQRFAVGFSKKRMGASPFQKF